MLYGQTAGEPLDEERMRELIEAADAEKFAKALERLQVVRHRLSRRSPTATIRRIVYDPALEYARGSTGPSAATSS